MSTDSVSSNKNKIWAVISDYAILTGLSIVIALSIHLFQLPNHFIFGGVTSIAMLISTLTGVPFSTCNIIINIALVLAAFLTLGKSFGIRTVYVTMLISLTFSVLDIILPISQPLTDQPMLEALIVVVSISALSAEFFNRGACSGGTDIAAMIIKKYTSINIGTALLLVDLIAVCFSFYIYDFQIGLFSLCGLLAKSFIVDTVLEMINNCKYFTIICTDPDPICDYIRNTVKRGATVMTAKGNYSGEGRTVIVTAVKRSQALGLRNYIDHNCPDAFMVITNTSEIVGKGFLLE